MLYEVITTKPNRTLEGRLLALAVALLVVAAPARAQMASMAHRIDGITGPAFTLTAKDGP